MENYLKTVSKVTGVDKEQILNKTRLREVVEARHLFCYFARKDRNSLYAIGKTINRNHSTVYCGANKIESFLSINDARTVNYVKEIKKELYRLRNAKKIYIVGVPDNWDELKQGLEGSNFEVCNSFGDDFKQNLRDLLSCDAICLLDNWSEKNKIEYRIAEILNYEIHESKTTN